MNARPLKKTTTARNAYTHSLGGQSVKSSFALVPAIAHDRINTALDDKFKVHDDQPDTEKEMNSFWGRFWLRTPRRAA
jgi:hypothetical protein